MMASSAETQLCIGTAARVHMCVGKGYLAMKQCDSNELP